MIEARKVWAVPVSLATTPGIIIYSLFLSLLRCFSSGGLLFIAYEFSYKCSRHDSRRVTPFGHLRIKAYWQLPEAYRSLSRPSSVVYV